MLAGIVLAWPLLFSCSSEQGAEKQNQAVKGSDSGYVAIQAGAVAELLQGDGKASHTFRDFGVSLYGEHCDHSGKEIRSRRYGAISIDTDGGIHRFRSVENLIWFLEEEERDPGSFAAIGIVDFISASRLMEPDDLVYHFSRNLPSPGGSSISALDPGSDEGLLYNIGEAYPGTSHSWDEIRRKLMETH